MNPSGTLLGRFKATLGVVPEKFLDILLPPHCLTCDAQVERQGSFCATCFSGLNLISAPFCARCGVPFAHEGEAERGVDGALLCAPCLTRAPGFAVARAASISIAVIAFTAGLMAAIRPMQLSSSSLAESFFAPIMRRAAMAVRSQGSVMCRVLSPHHAALGAEGNAPR